MSFDERKRTFDLAVDEAKGRFQTIMSCSDQNLDTVIELATHAEAVGADYIVVHAPVLHFSKAQDQIPGPFPNLQYAAALTHATAALGSA